MTDQVFTKKYVWEGRDIPGNVYKGEGDSTRECNEDATVRGSATCYITKNPNYKQPAESQIPTKIPEQDVPPSVNVYIAQVRDEAAQAIAFAQKDAAAWKEQAKGLADLVIAGWNALSVAGMQLPENTPEPDFLKAARAMVAPPEDAAVLDVIKKAEADEALRNLNS